MTKIEQGYVTQGFKLPPHWTWDLVAEQRAKYDIGEIYVPIAFGADCAAWGVPMRDGVFLKHPAA